MINKQRLKTAAATLVLAGSAGYVMQNGDALASVFSLGADGQKVAQTVQSEIGDTNLAYLPTPPIDAVVPSGFGGKDPVLLSRLVAFNAPISEGNLTDVPTPMFYPETCEISLDAVADKQAIVVLNLDAPCYQNQRVEVSHAGLEFSEVTASDGTLHLQIPALAEYDAFSVTFADGRSASIKALVPSFAKFERVSVNWTGDQNLNIHAFVDGAQFGDAGHVWTGATALSEDNLTPENGTLFRLGNPDLLVPRQAEIYSLPLGVSGLPVSVELIVEAEIDSKSCGSDLLARTYQTTLVGKPRLSELNLAFPACGGEGGFLVLKNLLQDIMIARN